MSGEEKAIAYKKAFEAIDNVLEIDKNGNHITLKFLEQKNNTITLEVNWTFNGETQPFRNPWIIVNPPCYVKDDTDIRFDPLSALKEIVDLNFKE